MINLQTRLGVDGSGVPNLTLVRVTPAELYEAANVMLAEMARIKAHLGITFPRDERREARNKRPRDVFAELLLDSGTVQWIVPRAQGRVIAPVKGSAHESA